MYNKITLMGRLVATPELNTTKAGVPVTSFSIAVDRRYKAKGEPRKRDFFNIVCWHNNAEFVCKNFKKGNMILVEGEMQTHRPEVKDGEKSYTWYEVLADLVSFTGERGDTPQPLEREITRDMPPVIPEIDRAERR